jgi:hypothetical protein
MAAEHMLYHLSTQKAANFETHIVRIGQISGDSSTGEWSIDEMIPMMMASLPVLGAVPRELPNVSWIPVDTCAQVIGDLIAPSLAAEDTRESCTVSVYNVSNPSVFDWKATVDLFARAANIPLPLLIDLREYILLIQKAQEKYGSQTTNCVPVVRLLASFLGGLNGMGWPTHYTLLDVSLTKKMSPSLAACLPIDEKMTGLLMNKIMTRMYGKMHPSKNPFTSIQTLKGSLPIVADHLKHYVLLFGPWSDLNERAINPGVADIWARLQKIATSVVNDVFGAHSWLDTK